VFILVDPAKRPDASTFQEYHAILKAGLRANGGLGAENHLPISPAFA
jgi:hypothetical protein